MDYILKDIDIELWSKVKAKATSERFRLVQCYSNILTIS
jgi:hypothetical protein